MNDIAQLHRMNIGSGFRAYSLRGGEMAEPIDPFFNINRLEDLEAAERLLHPYNPLN